MDFTAWIESLKSLAQLLAGFGLVTVVLAYVKYSVERRFWHSFKRRAEKWIDELVRVNEVHPNELTEEQWQFEVERLLTAASFGPLEIERLLKTAVVVAKGLASDKIYW